MIEQVSGSVTEVLFGIHAQSQEEIHEKKGLFVEKKTRCLEGLSRMFSVSPFPVPKQGGADRRRSRESQEMIQKVDFLSTSISDIGA